MDSQTPREAYDVGRQRGFTLLELLVAMAVFGILVAMMFSGLRFGTGAWAKSQARASETDEIVAVQNLLRREIATAYPEYVPLPQNAAYVNFDGAPSRVGFRGDLPQQIGLSELAWLEFSDEPGKNSNALVMSWKLIRSNGGQGFPAEKPTVMPILDGIVGLQFSYFGSDQPNQAPSWRDTWERRGNLPDLVRVQVAFESHVKRYWPPLVIATKIDADSRCLYDPVSRKCRGR